MCEQRGAKTDFLGWEGYHNTEDVSTEGNVYGATTPNALSDERRLCLRTYGFGWLELCAEMAVL